MSSDFGIVLVGNSLAAMVAARALADSGRDVTIVNASKGWGGHFTTIRIGSDAFDIGMVLHEFTSFSPQSSLESIDTYRPDIRNDVGRFTKVVYNYVSQLQDSRRIECPKMLFDGVIHDDILIANALTSLADLPFAGETLGELRSIVAGSAAATLHPSRKAHNASFLNASFEEASLANHGSTFHRSLIEPACRKLLNRGTREVLALYHRAAWLPLFYPETLLSYLDGDPQPLASTDFSYPAGGHVGDIATILKAALEANPRVHLVEDKPQSIRSRGAGGFEISLQSQRTLTCDRLGWSGSATELAVAIRNDFEPTRYQKASIALGFMRVPSADARAEFTVLNVVDPDIGISRITNQSRCSRSDHSHTDLVVECNPDYVNGLPTDGDGLGSRLAAEMVRLGIVADKSQVQCLDVKQMANALMLPSRDNFDGYQRERGVIRDAAAEIELIGPASGFFTSSFNDQVVQGLQLAAKWGH